MVDLLRANRADNNALLDYDWDDDDDIKDHLDEDRQEIILPRPRLKLLSPE